MQINKSAVIAITGRPNVGKSTLANSIIGEKVAIVTNKPQTTRNRIYAVKNIDDCQLVFADTPGFHTPRSKLGEHMVKIVRDSISGVDAILLTVEPINNIGRQERELIELIKRSKTPALLLINKVDTVRKEELFAVIETYSGAFTFEHIVPVSAKNRDGVDELLTLLTDYAQDGPQLFPEDMATDQPDSKIIEELIREKLLLSLEHEIPHGTAVELTRFTQREDSGIIDIDVTIYCEKSSHKSIIIGKKGAMLKKIGELSRRDIERFMGEKVFMQSWVKVKENWRDKEGILKNLGYNE